MTSAEMITNFKVQYDIVNLEGPGYEDSEILVLLNQAQIKEVLKEVAIKRWTNISNIIENEIGLTVIAMSYPNYLQTYSPLKEYIAYIGSQSRVTRTSFKTIGSYEWVSNTLIRKEDAGKYFTNTLNRPILLSPVVFEDNFAVKGLYCINVIIDAMTTIDSITSGFRLEYVRKPVDITAVVNCEVNTILHERIVNTAVDLAKEVFNAQEAGLSQQTDAIMDKPDI